MTEVDENSKEWIRHILKSLEVLTNKVDALQKEVSALTANCPEHRLDTQYNTEAISDLKGELSVLKGQAPNEKIEQHINAGKGWRVFIAAQCVALILTICSAVWFSGQFVGRVTRSLEVLEESHKRLTSDVGDLKMSRIGYNAMIPARSGGKTAYGGMDAPK